MLFRRQDIFAIYLKDPSKAIPPPSGTQILTFWQMLRRHPLYLFRKPTIVYMARLIETFLSRLGAAKYYFFIKDEKVAGELLAFSSTSRFPGWGDLPVTELTYGVASDYQRMGVARSLLRKAMADAHKFYPAAAVVHIDNSPSRRLLEGEGFTLITFSVRSKPFLFATYHKLPPEHAAFYI